MSWFGSTTTAKKDPSQLIHPVTARYADDALFGPLVKEDTEWLCAGGFATETQTFYATTATNALVMCQIIHSSMGVWYPTIQFTFRYVDAAKGINVWKSSTVTNFVTPPPSNGGPALDKRSSKSDQFTITVDPASPNRYTISGTYDEEVQVSMVFERLAEGWKLGAGQRGGISYFGNLAEAAASGGGSSSAADTTSGSDGFASHRFWPRCAVSGILRIGKEAIDLTDSRGIFVHAIQGMRPDSLATRWNFGNFQSSVAGGEGISLTMMEFKTTSAYGEVAITIGSVVVGDKLVAITSGTTVDGASVKHIDSVVDTETDYSVPSQIGFNWNGRSLSLTSDSYKASFVLDLKVDREAATYETRGLIEKVDVLGQIPYLLKKFVSYAVGTKPYIYTWLNPVTASITLPESPERVISVEGMLFNEATFVS